MPWNIFSFYLAPGFIFLFLFIFDAQIPGFLVCSLFILTIHREKMMLNIFWNTIQYTYDV